MLHVGKDIVDVFFTRALCSSSFASKLILSDSTKKRTYIASSFVIIHILKKILVLVQEARKRFDKSSLLYDQVCF